MNKTLSEQLCEIVGLPYYKTEVRVSEILPNKKKKIYLDFEQPENFVKLWKIINNQTKQELIQRLISRLRTESGWYTDGIKQSIRDYDGWVWR